MLVMIDTNILISLMLSPKGRVSAMMKALADRHKLCVASFCLEEMERVVRRKWPQMATRIDAFLSELPYEVVRTPDVLPETPHIRDASDSPVLATAMLSDADVLISGDKDFADVKVTRPRIMTPAQFAAEYL